MPILILISLCLDISHVSCLTNMKENLFKIMYYYNTKYEPNQLRTQCTVKDYICTVQNTKLPPLHQVSRINYPNTIEGNYPNTISTNLLDVKLVMVPNTL